MTKYAIKFTNGAYLKNHPSYHHFTYDVMQAMTFFTMTEANIVAIMYGNYSASEYTIEPVNQETELANA